SEHFGRYGLFAKYLTESGYLVIGCDFLGHGLSTETLDYVHFDDKDGDVLAYESVVLVKEYIEKTYKDKDVFVIGHSMGSFLARKLILDFPDFYKKAVISGTAFSPKILVAVGKMLTSIIRLFKGPKYVSKLIQNMAIDSSPNQMRKDGIITGINEEWLTRDVDIQQYYKNSNMCGQPFTVQANHDLMTWIQFIDNLKNIDQGRKDMPIYLMSGANDALSDYGKQIKVLYEKMQGLGYSNLKMKLYPECRHEILNELTKDEVYKDMLDFIKE
ncbi:MAG: alpha/beta fold hydrolase, partial [Tenericutes bacterium]|nr:alpha/beta fold hydrolase [Mycoplasmatota bacterium]